MIRFAKAASIFIDQDTVYIIEHTAYNLLIDMMLVRQEMKFCMSIVDKSV